MQNIGSLISISLNKNRMYFDMHVSTVSSDTHNQSGVAFSAFFNHPGTERTCQKPGISWLNQANGTTLELTNYGVVNGNDKFKTL